MKPIVLASTSRWRLQILNDAGIVADAMDPNVDESALVGDGPVETARLRAIAKASAVSRERPNALVIGADQVIYFDGETIGKPSDTDDWRHRLIAMRGRDHKLTTAVAIIEDGEVEAFEVTTVVRFRSDITDGEIDRYIQHGEAAGCAGGYMVERRGAWLIEEIRGDWLNVIGMPVLALVGRLRARGWRMPT
tara:strand:- start:88 stop:663 length:576 start_codon:yes stop_codon:yes gene_type:complete